MTTINEYRSVMAYKRLEDNAIDDIDAAVFTGDMFMLEKNRDQFREMMRRWESQLKSYEEIDESVSSRIG